MTLLPVFLLPILALAMIVFLPLFKSDDMRSTSLRSRRYRRTLLGRLAVAVLLLATLVTVILPIEGLNSLVQGILLVLAIMIPAYILSKVMARVQRNKPKGTIETVEPDKQEASSVPHETDPAAEPPTLRARRTRNTASENSTDTLSLHQRVAPQRSESADTLLADTKREPKAPTVGDKAAVGDSADERAKAAARDIADIRAKAAARDTANKRAKAAVRDTANERAKAAMRDTADESANAAERDTADESANAAERNTADVRAKSAERNTADVRAKSAARDTANKRAKAVVRDNADKSFREDTPAVVQEQLDRVADLVQTHDLGESQFSENDEKDSWQSVRKNQDRQSALSSQSVTADVAGTDLAVMTTSQMTDMVIDLRKTKTRLQKLVIAQQSAIDSERKAHEQSRLVARDAIKIMRDSRQAQKLAEKLARRERTERQRIEMQYNEVTGALDNALSIIAKRKLQEQPDAASGSS